MKSLKSLIRKAVNQTLKPFNICITSASHYDRVLRQSWEASRALEDLSLLTELSNRNSSQLLRTLRSSKSELRQDLVVLAELDFKRDGFFVEVGAMDGVVASNSYVMEKEFGWHGILAEPAKCWHEALTNNRTSHIETRCVWRDSESVVPFNEIEFTGLSAIEPYSPPRGYGAARKRTYDVKTISLDDLLDKYSAPTTIDYLSIDTEGSEYEILSSFGFNRYRFRVITCEHNFRPVERERIYALLTGKGYVRKFEKYSHYEDWYVAAE